MKPIFTKHRGRLCRLWAAAALMVLPCAACSARQPPPASSSAPPPVAEQAPPPSAAPESSAPPGEASAPFHLAAYLPASTAPEALELYEDSFRLLDRVTVITGLCWNAESQLEVIDGGYDSLMDRLGALREEYGFQIYATVYPQAALVRGGTAGRTVDTPEKRSALAASLLDHAGRRGLDGFDLDWETPRDEDEWADCSALIEALSAALGEKGLGLSAALYPPDTDKLSPPCEIRPHRAQPDDL